MFKTPQAVLWFYSTQKRHELAGSGLALNYVIYSRTVKHYQIKNAALKPLSRIIKSCLFLTYGFKYQLCFSLQKFCSAWKELVSQKLFYLADFQLCAKSKAVESFHFIVIHIMPRWTSLDYSRFNPPNHVKLIAGTTWEGKSVSRVFHFPGDPLIYVFFSRSCSSPSC